MKRAWTYLAVIIAVMAIPLTAIHSQEKTQEQKQEKRPPVSMDMTDVYATRNGIEVDSSPSRKGATNQLELNVLGQIYSNRVERSHIYKADEGWFKAEADYFFNSKEVKSVRVGFTDDGDQQNIVLGFFAPNKNIGLIPGIYSRASGFFVTDERPTLHISVRGGVCSNGEGDFVVNEAKFDTSGRTPRVVSFAATFSLRCEQGGAYQGAIYINAVPKTETPKTASKAEPSKKKH